MVEVSPTSTKPCLREATKVLPELSHIFVPQKASPGVGEIGDYPRNSSKCFGLGFHTREQGGQSLGMWHDGSAMPEPHQTR